MLTLGTKTSHLLHRIEELGTAITSVQTATVVVKTGEWLRQEMEVVFKRAQSKFHVAIDYLEDASKAAEDPRELTGLTKEISNVTRNWNKAKANYANTWELVQLTTVNAVAAVAAASESGTQPA